MVAAVALLLATSAVITLPAQAQERVELLGELAPGIAHESVAHFASISTCRLTMTDARRRLGSDLPGFLDGIDVAATHFSL